MKPAHKVVILTGASAGIGQTTAHMLAESGCRLILVARQPEPLLKLVSELNSRGHQTVAIPADVTDSHDIQRIINQTVSVFGTIDILINNAGIGVYDPLLTLSLDEARQVMAVNFFGPLHLMQAVLPAMQQNSEGGLIINISSIVGRRAVPSMGTYCASKAALERLTDSARLELHPHNIRLCTVYPGLTDTEFIGNALGSGSGLRSNRMRGVPSEKVARTILKAINSERRDLFVSSSDRFLVALSMLFPSLADFALRKLLQYRNATP